MEENNFKLLDLNGSDSCIDYNVTKNALIYSVGCMIVYWDISTDKKMYIKYHEGIIGAIKFSRSGNYFLSVDKLFSPHFVIWDVPTMEIYFHTYLPLSKNYTYDDFKFNRSRPEENKSNIVKEIFVEFLSANNLILIINFDKKQYLYCLDLAREIKISYESTIEVDSDCLALKSFLGTNIFVSIEEKTIKIWNYIDSNYSKIKLIKKIYTKQNLLKNSLSLCEYFKIICVISEEGACILLDDTGKFLISLSASKKENFSSCFITNEKLLLGTNIGKVYLYTLNGYKCQKILDYDPSLKTCLLLHKIPTLTKEYGPTIENLILDVEKDILIAKYHDNSLLVTKFFLGNKKSELPLKKYSIFNFSHFGKVNDILWIDNDRKSFITCSEDQSLILWTFKGDKWVTNYFDITKIIDKQLNNFSDQIFITDSESKSQIKTLIIHPSLNNTLIAGDNKGRVYLINLEDSSKMRQVPIRNFAIDSLSASSSGNFLLVGFITGMCILLDLFNDFKILTVLEDHFNQSIIKDSNCFSFGHIMKIKGKLRQNLTNKGLKNNNFYMTQNSESSLSILTLKDSQTFRIQNVSMKNQNFLKSTFKEYSFDNKIKKATLHPSEDYLIVLLDSNEILINKIETNGICGKIVPNLIVYDFKIDPSGLYLGLLIESGNYELELEDDLINFNLAKENFSSRKGSFIDKNSLHISENDAKSLHTFKGGASLTRQKIVHTSKEISSNRTSILFYEVGTGKYSDCLSNVFKISMFKFSSDGKFLIVCSDSGCISVWQLPKIIKENIQSVLEEMRNNQNFWDSFRINYYHEKIELLNYTNLITKSYKDDLMSIRKITSRDSLNEAQIKSSPTSIYITTSTKQNNSLIENGPTHTEKKAEKNLIESNRLINKDPSIYAIGQSSVIKTKIDSTYRNDKSPKYSTDFKNNTEDIRNRNIMNAIKQLQINNVSKVEENKTFKMKHNDIGEKISTTKILNENKISLFPEPIDIDDLEPEEFERNKQDYVSDLERRRNSSLADEIEFAYDNIDNFEKMHNLK